MTTARLSLTAGVAWATTMAATAQLHQIAFTVDDSDPQGNHATDCALAANAGALVTATNMKISLFDMAGVEEEAHWITDNGFPFSISDPAGHFFDPRAEYDTVNDRLWVLYSEDAKQSHPMATGPVAAIHLGVSKASTTPQTFGTSDWWYYTGPPGAPGNGGKAIDLMASGISGEQFTEIADFPSMSVDNKAVYLFPNDEVTLTSTYCAAVIVPLSHDGGTKSILAGDRPDDEDVVVLRLSGFDPPDNSIYHSAVQEPFDQFEPAQFVVTLTDIPWLPGRRTQLRLGAVFFDDVEEVWSYKFEDMDVTSTTTLDFHTTIGDGPATPASTFKPLARSSFFSSAVFAYVGNDEPRIFCAHHIKPDDNPSGGGNPVNQHVVQWYVIDPDLNDFLTTSWAPAVLTTARLPLGSGEHAYHPVIGVTPQGVAFIEYTFSSGTVWPQIRRAQLTSNYTGVQTDTLVQAGPSLSYTGPRWADFNDMQAVPSGCGFVSLHTLVSDGEANDVRDVWLFENPMNCNSAEMTGDGIIDEDDLLFFSNEYATGSRRVDMDRSRGIDATDYALFMQAYAAR